MSRTGGVFAGMMLLSQPTLAQVAGPPAPASERRTPAESAMDRYGVSAGARRPAPPCRRSGEEIVVCAPVAGETSPYRMPLPDERDPDDAPIVRGAHPGPPDLGRPGIAPTVTFGLKLKRRL